MDNDLQAKLAERMAELPADVRAAIISADFGKKLQTIGARHQLHIDQIGKLEDEVLLVMLAFSDPDDFESTLVEQLQVSTEVAGALAEEIATEMLLPIRNSMREFTELRAAREIHDAAKESLDEDLPAVAASVPTTLAPRPVGAPLRAPNTPPVATPPFQAAETMLTTKTVAPPPAAPAQPPVTTTPTPKNYKTDPYHEPVE